MDFETFCTTINLDFNCIFHKLFKVPSYCVYYDWLIWFSIVFCIVECNRLSFLFKAEWVFSCNSIVLCQNIFLVSNCDFLLLFFLADKQGISKLQEQNLFVLLIEIFTIFGKCRPKILLKNRRLLNCVLAILLMWEDLRGGRMELTMRRGTGRDWAVPFLRGLVWSCCGGSHIGVSYLASREA